MLLLACGSAFAGETLTYANWQFQETGRAEFIDKFVALFEKENPGVKVEKVSVPYSSYNDALATQFEARGGPDVLFVQDLALIPWIERGYLAELDSLIDLGRYKDSFPVQQQSAVRRDKTYGVIYEGFPYAGLSYNKKLFAEAGVEVPTTPDEFIAASDKIFEKTGKPGLIHPTDLSNASYIMQGGMIVIHGFGGKIVDDAGNFTVNKPEFVAGVDFQRRIYELKSTPSGIQFGVQRQQFLAGDAGMVMDGSYWPAIVKLNNAELYENLGVAKLPFPNPATPFETNWFAVGANSKKKELAAKFVEFMLRPEIADEWAVTGSIPGLAYTYKAVTETYPWFKIYEDASPFGLVRPVTGHEADTNEINRMIADSIASAMSGQQSAQNAMDNLQKELEARFGRK
jgi:ABC-type glycerol-3-phosphate transport system substrate-binding protein